MRYVLSVHCLSPPVGDASGASRGERGGDSRIHPRTEPPQSGVPAPLGACLFVFKKRGDLPPLFSLKPLKTLKPFLGPFCPTAPRASGRVGGSKDEYGWVKRRIWVGQKTNAHSSFHPPLPLKIVVYQRFSSFFSSLFGRESSARFNLMMSVSTKPLFFSKTPFRISSLIAVLSARRTSFAG